MGLELGIEYRLSFFVQAGNNEFLLSLDLEYSREDRKTLVHTPRFEIVLLYPALELLLPHLCFSPHNYSNAFLTTRAPNKSEKGLEFKQNNFCKYKQTLLCLEDIQ